ncbi:MAG: addiction module toxin RelE [Armatimonadetes bacterium]|nr:addiction module toxin RelE [Armatimonadota bacterium]
MIREFIELPSFTRAWETIGLGEDELADLQHDVMLRRGRIDAVTGVPGLEKMRWRNPRRQRGVRGGLRVFLADFVDLEKTVLIYVMDKAERDDLSHEQKLRLGRVIKDLRRELVDG